MEQWLNELMPWLGLFCAFGVGFGVPAVILRWMEIREERKQQAERDKWSHNVVPLHKPLDRSFLDRCELHRHMHRPSERVKH